MERFRLVLIFVLALVIAMLMAKGGVHGGYGFSSGF
jgi:hypothetical protein